MACSASRPERAREAMWRKVAVLRLRKSRPPGQAAVPSHLSLIARPFQLTSTAKSAGRIVNLSDRRLSGRTGHGTEWLRRDGS